MMVEQPPKAASRADRVAMVRRFRRDESIAARRRGEIIRLCEFWIRVGVLPETEAGLARVAANAALFLHREYLVAAHVVDLCCGLVDLIHAQRAVAAAQRQYHDRSKNFRLIDQSMAGDLLGLDKADRRGLAIRTMEATDEPRDERVAFVKAKRRDDARERMRRRRVAAGIKPRAKHLTVEAPWAALGVSRAKFYRDRHRETERSLTVLNGTEGERSVSQNEAVR